MRCIDRHNKTFFSYELRSTSVSNEWMKPLEHRCHQTCNAFFDWSMKPVEVKPSFHDRSFVENLHKRIGNPIMYVWQHMQSNIKLVHVYRNIFSYSILIRIRHKSMYKLRDFQYSWFVTGFESHQNRRSNTLKTHNYVHTIE